MKRILVPLDGSQHAARALDAAVRVARASGGQLHLVTVAERQRLTEAVWWETYMGKLRAELEGSYAKVRNDEEAGLAVSRDLLQGEVVDTLLEEARRWEADLIVMSTHGLGGLARAWIGSVADALLAETEVPVLLVRPEEEGEDGSFAPSPIMITLDGSSFAESAVEPAASLAKALGADVVLLSVISYPAQVTAYLPEPVVNDTDFLGANVQHAKEYLAGVKEKLEADGLSVGTHVVVSATPAYGVLDAAKEADAGLIVTASHGRRGPARWLLGGVTDKVIRGGHTPVLVVPGEA